MSDLIAGLSIADYHAHPALSKTQLDLINKSPAHFRSMQLNPKPPTDAMLLGAAFHAFVLQPEVFEAEYALPEEQLNRSIKAGKEAWAELVAANPDKTVINTGMSELRVMRDSLMSHSLARAALTGGIAERSVFWNAYGVQCRCRPDYWREGVLYDLKTTMDARADAFSRACWDRRYHVQSAFYLDGYHNVTGEAVGDFVFIAIEKEPPYAVAMYHANEAMVAQGRNEYIRDIDVYRECLELDVWPGYPEEIKSILLPRWAQEETE